MNLNSRLRIFINSLGLTNQEFERNCEMGNGMVNRITDSIKPKTLYKISNSYPELNTEWLKSGIGEMILDASISKNNTQNNSAFSGRIIASSLNKILEAESLAAELLIQNRELTKQINTLMIQNSSLIDIITKNNDYKL